MEPSTSCAAKLPYGMDLMREQACPQHTKASSAYIVTRPPPLDGVVLRSEDGGQRPCYDYGIVAEQALADLPFVEQDSCLDCFFHVIIVNDCYHPHRQSSPHQFIRRVVFVGWPRFM